MLARLTAPIHGIIYCPTRASADSLATRLTSAGLRASAYHAGLEPFTRLGIQAAFLKGEVIPLEAMQETSSSFKLICATTAFGMGIDMPNIRFVVHYGMPRGMESYVQESGRAGRDNKAASSLVLYTREDKDRCLWRMQQDANREKNKALATSKQNSLKKIIEFCENTDCCRHRLISAYFGEEGKSAICDYACDVCKEEKTQLRQRKEKGLATEEDAMEYTQKQVIGNYDYD